MYKSIISFVVIIIIISIVGIVIYRNGSVNSNNIKENVSNNKQEEVQGEESNEKMNTINNIEKESKVLVVYYSAQNHTKLIAEKIVKNLNADIFEIVPEEIYSNEDLDWTNSNSRVSKEHNNESLRNIKLKNTKVNNWDEYDIVLIGYPIWWGIAAWPMNTFVKANNFDGKTVIPFCTSASSGLGQSGKLLEKEANSGNWQEGHRFSSSATDNDIKSFTDSIK